MTSSADYVLSLFVLFATPLPTNPSLSRRFAGIVADLRRAVAAHGSKHHALIPLMVLLWSRLGRMDARFQALVARLCAGLQSPAGHPTSPRAAPRPQTTGWRAAASPHRFPQGFAWLVRLMPQVAAGYGSQLQHLLADPGMPALLAAEPRLGHILRPLCNMLAIRPGPELSPPPRATATGTAVTVGAATVGAATASSRPPSPEPRPNWQRSAAIRPAGFAPRVSGVRLART